MNSAGWRGVMGRRAALKPGSGATVPILPALASVMTQAISSPKRPNTSSTAGMLLYGNTIVSADAGPGTPGVDGRPSVATPEPASASTGAPRPGGHPENLMSLARAG